MLNTFAEIRPRERRAVYSAFLTLFGTMIGHALLETARDALFLTRLPATQLPWVYLTVAVASSLIYALQQNRSRGSTSDPRQLGYLLLGSAAVTLGFWVLVDRAGAWVYYALYTWLGVFSTVVLVRFWLLVGGLFTVTQAKRLFAPIGVGGVLGAIVGAGVARLLTSWLDPRSLVVAASGALTLVSLAPLWVWPRLESSATPVPTTESREDSLLLPLKAIWSRPYLRRVAEVLVIATITLTMVDFLFKYYVAQAISPARLPSFIAGTYLVLNALSLLMQISVVGWLVRSLGVNRVLSVLPALLLIGAAGVATLGGLIPVLLMKAFDGTLRHSLHRTSTEVLYVPLTAELRSRVKGIMDVLAQRGGQAFTSVLLLVIAIRGPLVLILSVLIICLCLLWIWSARRLKNHYLDLFRENLNEVSVQTRVDFPELDLASLETLIAALNSPNDSEVMATLDILGEQDRVRLIPALILFHPSSSVVIRALELFTTSGRDDFIPITNRLLEHHAPEVRAAVLRARSWTSPDPRLYEEFSTDPSPIVRATALIGMVSYGSKRHAEAMDAIEAIARDGFVDEKLSLARAIRYSPGAGYDEVLLTLADTENLRVRQATILSMQEILSYRFIPKLMEMLPMRSLRTPVRDTLVAMGTPVLHRMDKALGDPELHPTIRRQIPRVISHFPPGLGADILMKRLVAERDGGIRYRILRAMGRLVAIDPELPLDRHELESITGGTLATTFRIMDWRVLLERGATSDPARRTPVHELMNELLEHKESQSIERIFRLLGLLYPRAEILNLYRGSLSSNPEVRSSSQELLEDLLDPPLREGILTLLDDIPMEDKLDRTPPFYSRSNLDYEALLGALLELGNVGMRSLVAYHAGELGMVGLRENLRNVSEGPGGMTDKAMQRALELMDNVETERPGDGR